MTLTCNGISVHIVEHVDNEQYDHSNYFSFEAHVDIWGVMIAVNNGGCSVLVW